MTTKNPKPTTAKKAAQLTLKEKRAQKREKSQSAEPRARKR